MREGSASILVVDDDEEYLEYMEAALGRAGYPCVVAASAEAARLSVETSRFRLIITDLRLPGSSGIEVLDVARRADPLAVVVVMTAYGTVDAALEAVRHGAYDFLLKPCAADVLQATIQRALEHNSLLRQLVERTEEVERLRREFKQTAALVDEVSRKLRAPLTPENAEGMLRLLHELARSSTNLTA